MFDKVNWLLLFAWGLGLSAALGMISALLLDTKSSVQWLAVVVSCYTLARLELRARAIIADQEDDDDYTI